MWLSIGSSYHRLARIALGLRFNHSPRTASVFTEGAARGTKMARRETYERDPVLAFLEDLKLEGVAIYIRDEAWEAIQSSEPSRIWFEDRRTRRVLVKHFAGYPAFNRLRRMTQGKWALLSPDITDQTEWEKIEEKFPALKSGSTAFLDAPDGSVYKVSIRVVAASAPTGFWRSTIIVLKRHYVKTHVKNVRNRMRDRVLKMRPSEVIAFAQQLRVQRKK